jgi:hypothetical protein
MATPTQSFSGYTLLFRTRMIGQLDQQEQHLCAIIGSKQATPDEKFQALVDLARLAGIVLHVAAEGEAEISADLQQIIS